MRYFTDAKARTSSLASNYSGGSLGLKHGYVPAEDNSRVINTYRITVLALPKNSPQVIAALKCFFGFWVFFPPLLLLFMFIERDYLFIFHLARLNFSLRTVSAV